MNSELIKEKAESGALGMEGVGDYLSNFCSKVDKDNQPWVHKIPTDLFADLVKILSYPSFVDKEGNARVVKALRIPLVRTANLQKNFSELEDKEFIIQSIKDELVGRGFTYLYLVQEYRPSSINPLYVEDQIRYLIRAY